MDMKTLLLSLSLCLAATGLFAAGVTLSTTNPAAIGTLTLNGVPVLTNTVIPHTICMSTNGAALNANLMSGGGTDDSVAIQTALDRQTNYSPLIVIVDGPARISRSLGIRSNTKLYFPPGAGLFLTANANCTAITNVGMAGNSVNSSNIIVEGLFLNGNGVNQSKNENNSSAFPNTWNFGVWFSGIRNSTFRDIQIFNAKTFGFTLSCFSNIVIDGLTVTITNSDTFNHDGLHLWGFGTNLLASNLRFEGLDDNIIGINTSEGNSIGWSGVNGTGSDLRRGTNVGNMKNLRFENITAIACDFFFRFTGRTTNNYVDGVSFNNFYAEVGVQGLDWSQVRVSDFKMTDCIFRLGENVSYALIGVSGIDSFSSVSNVMLKNITINDYNDGEFNPVVIDIRNNVANANISGITYMASDNSTPLINVSGDTAATALTISGVIYANNGMVLKGASTGPVRVSNVAVESGATVVDPDGTFPDLQGDSSGILTAAPGLVAVGPNQSGYAKFNYWLVNTMGTPSTWNLDNSLKYLANGYGAAFNNETSDGRLAFYLAASGVAGNTATLIEPMSISQSGVLTNGIASIKTNVAVIATSSAYTGSYAIDTLYTNFPQRAWLVGSLHLVSAVTGSARVQINYTNSGVGFVVPVFMGSIADTKEFPFSIPLDPAATFKLVSTFGTGASGYATNVVLWRF